MTWEAKLRKACVLYVELYVEFQRAQAGSRYSSENRDKVKAEKIFWKTVEKEDALDKLPQGGGLLGDSARLLIMNMSRSHRRKRRAS